jgi:hypothetical protein
MVLSWLMMCQIHMLNAQVWEDFSDGDISNGVAWSGDTTQFVVNNGKLRLNSTGNDTSFLATGVPFSSDTLEWRFKLQINFSPSSQNYARFVLVADTSGVEGYFNGYFLQLGESGSADAIVLCRHSAGQIVPLLRGRDSTLAAGGSLSVRILYHPGGQWQLLADYAGGEDYVGEGTVQDAFSASWGYTGMVCAYTSSNASGFFWDDIYAGRFVQDTVAPFVVESGLVNDSTIRIRWSEQIDTLSGLSIQNYSLHQRGIPLGASPDTADKKILYLSFTRLWAMDTVYCLTIAGVADVFGNLMPDSQHINLFIPGQLQPGDLVINEVMCNPAGAPSLPPSEYVELKNRSGKVLLVSGVTIQDASSSAQLPPDTLFPGEYRCYADASAVAGFQVLGIKVRGVAGFPSLNNDADELLVTAADGSVIERLDYTSDMYRDPLRDDYGWSLERIDADFICPNPLNWQACHDSSGGTPGRENSRTAVFTDTEGIFLAGIFPLDSLHIVVYFSEFPDSISGSNLFSIEGYTGQILSAGFSSSAPSCTLRLSDPISQGDVYSLSLAPGFSDCAGNELEGSNSLEFGLPGTSVFGKIVLSEVLFNPLDGGADFVEVYNQGKSPVDLFAIRLAHADPSIGVVTDAMPFADRHVLLMPGTFAVATPDPELLIDHYPGAYAPGLHRSVLPSYNDDEGVVVLLDKSLMVCEQFRYKEGFHFPLLQEREGVSLERISFFRSADDSSNWHSAATISGGATPGFKNSQALDDDLTTSGLGLSPRLFSPDNDGVNDVLSVTLEFDQPGFVVNLKVFTEQGQPIRTLAEHELMGNNGVWIWDGTSDDGTLSDVGMYIVLAEAFHIKGQKAVLRKVCVLAKQL